MISIEEAQQILFDNQPALRVTRIALATAHGRCLAEDIVAPEPSPRYTNSAMDGYAVFGGTRVSSALLIDTLWPDSDGDAAWNTLKVALSRLRKINSKEGEEPMQWIAVKHKHISLARSLCSVDSLVFQDLLAASLHEKNNNAQLIKALDLYTDDFLAYDHSEPWIEVHREFLRDQFITGVFTLFDSAKDAEHIEMALPYLKKAARKDPLNEEIHARLMRGYITMGYPAKAMLVFKQAESALKRELGIKPGSVLLSLVKSIRPAS